MEKPRFTVQYEDDTSFSGFTMERDWMKIDESKKIIRAIFVFNNSQVILEGYKQYNHVIEKVAFGKSGISRFMYMGRKENSTDIFVIDLLNKRMFKKELPIYQEYGKQILNGWQEGKLNNPRMLFNNAEIR